VATQNRGPLAFEGLTALQADPEARALLVPDTQARGACALLLPHYIAVCPRGPIAAGDWEQLAGRNVDVLIGGGPDNARIAAQYAGRLLPHAAQVRIIDMSADPETRRLPDLVAEGWDETRALAWAADRVRVVEKVAPKKTNGHGSSGEAEPAKGRKHDGRAPVIQGGDSVLATLQSMGLKCNSGGFPHATISNAALIFQQHPHTRGHIWFDRFRGTVYHDINGAPARWTDHDEVKLAAWLTHALDLPKFTLGLVKEAITLAALANERNSVVDWLNSLTWDGDERLTTWLSDCLGVPQSAYSQAVGRNWLISMVARAMVPGCQVDHMPILEGKMGRGKSSFLRLLGGEWYSALPDAFGSKDFLQGIVGQWLIEVPDLAGFNRREHRNILAIITTPIDRYRASYGRHTEDHPRTCVFTATSETDEYLQDAAGRRRFWPLRCQSIDLDALACRRAQLFAEAVHAYRAGQAWHETPEAESDLEQLERVEEDSWTQQILAYVEGRTRNGFNDVIVPVMTSTGILSALGVELKDQHDGQKRRVKTVMSAHGYVQKVTKEHGLSLRKWVKAG
jgi:putative DNA primase/helicase